MTNGKGEGCLCNSGNWHLVSIKFCNCLENLATVSFQSRTVLHGVIYSVMRSVHVGFVVDKPASDGFFCLYFYFPLSASFHRCSTLTFIYTMIVEEGQKSLRNFPKQNHFGNRKAIKQHLNLYSLRAHNNVAIGVKMSIETGRRHAQFEKMLPFPLLIWNYVLLLEVALWSALHVSPSGGHTTFSTGTMYMFCD